MQDKRKKKRKVKKENKRNRKVVRQLMLEKLMLETFRSLKSKSLKIRGHDHNNHKWIWSTLRVMVEQLQYKGTPSK